MTGPRSHNRNDDNTATFTPRAGVSRMPVYFALGSLGVAATAAAGVVGGIALSSGTQDVNLVDERPETSTAMQTPTPSTTTVTTTVPADPHGSGHVSPGAPGEPGVAGEASMSPDTTPGRDVSPHNQHGVALPDGSTSSYNATGTVHGNVYQVAQGDTLSGISSRLGISVDRLVDMNGIHNPHLIYAGSALVIA